MEREIANVAASCAMRGFRYMAFPPIVFEPPTHLVAAAVWEPAAAEPAAMEPVAAEPVALELAVPAPTIPAPMAWALPPAAAPAPAVEAPPIVQRPAVRPVGDRRFALLAEVSAQLGGKGGV